MVQARVHPAGNAALGVSEEHAYLGAVKTASLDGRFRAITT